MTTEVVPKNLEEVISEESCKVERYNLAKIPEGEIFTLTISRSIRQQNKPKVWMDDDIGVSLSLLTNSPSVGKTQLSVPRQALENCDDMLCGLVRLVDDDDPTKLYCPK